LADEIEFDWDDGNRSHLAAHAVVPDEAEQLLGNDPVDVDFGVVHGEDRYRSVGVTDLGRLLSVVWTVRRGKVRVITAFPASVMDQKAFLGRPL